MKFGGTSVADPEMSRSRAAARRAREAGNRVVGVLSAMGHTTDELLDLAQQVSARPHPRELDMLISVGERISCALGAMAIHDLGHQAISLTGSQAGIVTDTAHGKAKIVDVRARRIHEALDEDRSSSSPASRASRPTSTSRRSAAAARTRPPSRSRQRSAPTLRDLHRRRGRLHRRPPACPRRAQAPRRHLRGDAGDGGVGREGAQLRSVEFARNHGVKLHVRSTFATRTARGSGGGRTDAREGDDLRGDAHARGDRLQSRGHPGAPVRGARGRRVNVDTIVRTAPRSSSPPRSSDRRTPSARSTGSAWVVRRDDLGKVSLVGAGMKSHPGVAAKTFATLDAAGIESPIVTTSPIKIACHVAQRDVERAVVGAARGLRLGSAQNRSGRSDRRGRPVTVGCCGSAATTTSGCSRRHGPRAPRSTVSASSTPRPKRSPRAISTSCSSRSGRQRRASSSRTQSPAGRSAWTSRRPTVSQEGVPLVVPEVNGERALEHDGILANPNCCAIPLACVLKPLRDAAGLARVRIATYQSASGAGAAAMERLARRAAGRTRPPDGLALRRRRVRRGGETSRRDAEDPRAPLAADHRHLRTGAGDGRPRRGGLGRDRGAAPRRRRRTDCSPRLPPSARGVRPRRGGGRR